MEDRVAIFIDGSNLYHAVKDKFGRADLNFAEFAKKLVGTRRLVRTYYYNALQDPALRPEGHREQQEFLDTLRKTPYLEVRLGGMKRAAGIPVEKGLDIMLATDLLQFAWNGLYDVAVLVSGDADFAYAVQAVKNAGKQVEVAYFEGNVSRDILEVADFGRLLDLEFFKGLWARGPHRTGGGRRRRGGRVPLPAVDGQVQAQPQVAVIAGPPPGDGPAEPSVVSFVPSDD